ncbi:glycoside hydrolase superfamily, partial [Rhexocercosporidium sp. MPI-PUGE-AT-0058]
ATYDQSSKTNLALYWGQGGGQQRLQYFCEQSTVDVIPIGFIHIFPQQGNGFPGSNFANQCWGGTYVYPVGYIAMASRLRQHFKTASKKYILTAAPQCVVIDANMGALISQVQFDIIFVQYYNTPQCSARNWVNANTNFAMDGVERTNGFTYNTWSNFLSGTMSANAKLYIGVPGAPDAGGFYLSPNEISLLIKAHFCKDNFGGVMIWEATSAENN